MRAYERINAVVSLTLIGLTLYFVLEFPQQVAAFTLFGSPLELESPRQWLMVVLLAGVAMAGTDAVILAHPELPTRRLIYRAMFWALPGLLVVLATQTLGLAPGPIVWAGGLAMAGVLLWFTIYTEYRQLAPDGGPQLGLRLWRQFIGYAVILSLFILIYQTRSRSAISATSVMVVSAIGALGLLGYDPKQVSKIWLFAAVVGLGLGQITWALNYWRTGALNAGLLLFLIFYVLVGLSQQQLAGTLSQRSLWEYGAIASVALVVILIL
jgi:hypothetical protein